MDGHVREIHDRPGGVRNKKNEDGNSRKIGMLAAAAVGPLMETSFMPWRPSAHPYGGRPKALPC
jgi:hypothetical protein